MPLLREHSKYLDRGLFQLFLAINLLPAIHRLWCTRMLLIEGTAYIRKIRESSNKVTERGRNHTGT
jgi:hypothetical protein